LLQDRHRQGKSSEFENWLSQMLNVALVLREKYVVATRRVPARR
jgi:hypothetical protein